MRRWGISQAFATAPCGQPHRSHRVIMTVAGKPSEHNSPDLRLVVAGRGDHYEPYLLGAFGRRLDDLRRIDAELTKWQRYLVAGATFRPSRRVWVERFFKSSLAWKLRTRRANRALSRLNDIDVVFQNHALFGVTHPPAVLFVDCTHRQSADYWPDWNPLRGQQLQNWYDRERQQYLTRAHIFAICENTATSLIEDYGIPAERVSVVGAGPNLYELPALLPRDEPGQAPMILMVGNDFVRKGGNVLLEAFQLVRLSLPEARLVIVGEDARGSSQGGVEFVGRVHSRADMADLYGRATVFCMPSLFEPFGLSLLEAMAFGLPCISTLTGGVPEMILEGVTGRLVPPGDVFALADALLKTLTTPGEAVSQGAAGRRRIETTYTWDHVVDRMLPVIERIKKPVHT
jgi:starch synthase